MMSGTENFDLFLQQKRRALASEDLSRKGCVDAPIVDLVDFINSSDRFFTTSSCSGRTIVFEEVNHLPAQRVSQITNSRLYLSKTTSFSLKEITTTKPLLPNSMKVSHYEFRIRGLWLYLSKTMGNATTRKKKPETMILSSLSVHCCLAQTVCLLLTSDEVFRYHSATPRRKEEGMQVAVHDPRFHRLVSAGKSYRK